MKKIFFLLSVASLVVCGACNKQVSDLSQTKSLSLTAAMEQHEDATKTSLSGTSVLWTANDEIAVFDNAATPLKAELKTSTGGATTATFADVSIPAEFATANCAIYPYAAATSATSAGVITFSVDGTQTYVANSFDPEHNVMVGTVSGGNVAFKNVFGLLKLSLKGVINVGKIELTSKTDSQYLYGTFQVDATSVYTATYVSGGGTTITLNCGGVQLDALTETDFYFVVPVNAFGGGFTAKIYDVDGYSNTDLQVDLVTTKDNTIVRSKVKAMPICGVTLLDTDEYTEVTYIQTDGNSWINTGLNGNMSYTYLVDFQQIENLHRIWGVFGQESYIGLNMSITYFTYLESIMVRWEHLSGSQRYAANDISSNDRHAIKIANGTLYVDGISKGKAEGHQDNFTIAYPCYLGTVNPANSTPSNSSVSKFFLYKVWNTTPAITRYFIPAKRVSDSVLGMYDVIGKAFYTNAGTGTFTSGGDLAVQAHK